MLQTVPVFKLDESLVFPPPHLADPDGLLAVGGDLRPERLVEAYARGIFPWPIEGLPLMWHSPDPRFVLQGGQLHVPRSVAKVVRRGRFRVTLDTAFDEVVEACAKASRPGQEGTWITDAMRDGYGELHRLGLAHSVEAWSEGQLVGGLYGVSLGAAFFGESMFARAADASKVAFVSFVRQLETWGFAMIDAQVHTHHLERFGARFIARGDYLGLLEKALETPTRQGRWRFDEGSTLDGSRTRVNS